MSSDRELNRALAVLAGQLGGQVRDERLRRRRSLRDVAQEANISASLLQWLETGHPASLESYVRVASALALRPEFRLIDPRRRGDTVRQQDVVHAAMGEALVGALALHASGVAVDEPFQHYQFAGRADVVAWSLEREALLHIENRTRFPNLQEAFGSYNAKRRYLAAVMAKRLDLRGGWRSMTHVMCALWSSEILHAIRMHRSSFASLCPDPPDDFEAWLGGGAARIRDSSTLIVLDPVARPRQRLYIASDTLDTTRPRYTGYAEAAAAVERRWRRT